MVGNLFRVRVAWKESLPIVLACAIWGRHWIGGVVTFHCAPNSQTTKPKPETSSLAVARLAVLSGLVGLAPGGLGLLVPVNGNDTLFLEIASVIPFSTPGVCTAHASKWK